MASRQFTIPYIASSSRVDRYALRRMRRKYLSLLLLLSPVCLGSDALQGLSGDYTVGGETVIDAPDSEPTATHMYFRIKDSAAKEMYDIIESAPVRDICLDDGTLSKWARNIQCSFNPRDNTYVCYFSVGINSNTIGPGTAC